LIVLARWDNRTECSPRPAAICPDVTEARLLADNDDAHRNPSIVQVKPGAAAQVATSTAVTFVPDDEPWIVPRSVQARFVNPAAIAVMRMGYADELPAGFRFGAGVVTTTGNA